MGWRLASAIRISLIAAVTVGAACAPVGYLQPNVPMRPGQTNEIGIGLSTGAITNVPFGNQSPIVEGRAFWAHEWNHRISLGASAAYVHSSFRVNNRTRLGERWGYQGITTGVSLRAQLFQNDAVRVALEVQAGLGWIQGGLPLGVRLHDRVWVGLSPSVAYAQRLDLRIPLALVLRFTDTTMAVFEGSALLGFGDEPSYPVTGLASMALVFRL